MTSPDPFSRYHRQMLLAGIGEAGQQRLREARVLLVGCGALGSVIADTLVRAGVGTLTLIDRDVVEITNLQRQVLFDEEDVEAGRPKAFAAERKLRAINREVTIHAHADDFHAGNAAGFVRDVDLILDGLDNFETRYLLNDLAVSRGLPYIYGGAVGTTGLSMAVLPRRTGEPGGRLTWAAEQTTPCLRCMFPEAPPPGASPTCDTAGVLGPVVVTIAAHQSTQAIKLLTDNIAALDRSMLSIDLWRNEWRRFQLADPAPDCPCCAGRQFEFLAGRAASRATSLCGRNAVQVLPETTGAGTNGPLDLPALARRLGSHGEFSATDAWLRGTFSQERGGTGEPIELTLFPNGRAIVRGTDRPETARSLYARYVGS